MHAEVLIICSLSLSLYRKLVSCMLMSFISSQKTKTAISLTDSIYPWLNSHPTANSFKSLGVHRIEEKKSNLMDDGVFQTVSKLPAGNLATHMVCIYPKVFLTPRGY